MANFKKNKNLQRVNSGHGVSITVIVYTGILDPTPSQTHTHTRTITFLFFILSKSVWTDNRTLVLLNFDVFKALRLCLEHRHSLRSSARMKFVWILFFTGKMGLWLHQRVQRGKGSFDSEAGDSRTFATPRKCSNSLSWLQARIRSGSAKWFGEYCFRWIRLLPTYLLELDQANDWIYVSLCICRLVLHWTN